MGETEKCRSRAASVVPMTQTIAPLSGDLGEGEPMCSEGSETAAPSVERGAHGDRATDVAPCRVAKQFVQQASTRQLCLFGFPPPGHPYWTEGTLTGIAQRYEGLDVSAAGWTGAAMPHRRLPPQSG